MHLLPMIMDAALWKTIILAIVWVVAASLILLLWELQQGLLAGLRPNTGESWNREIRQVGLMLCEAQ